MLVVRECVLDGVSHVLAEVAYGSQVVFRGVDRLRVDVRHRPTLVEPHGDAEQVPEVDLAAAYQLGAYGL